MWGWGVEQMVVLNSIFQSCVFFTQLTCATFSVTRRKYSSTILMVSPSWGCQSREVKRAVRPRAITGTYIAGWCHQMETFSALLAVCEGNSPVIGEFPSQRSMTLNFDVFFDLCRNKQLSNSSTRRWFETPLCLLCHYCDDCRNSWQWNNLHLIGTCWLKQWMGWQNWAQKDSR